MGVTCHLNYRAYILRGGYELTNRISHLLEKLHFIEFIEERRVS